MPINIEFQELMRQFSVNSAQRIDIMNGMKTNLKSRNNGESVYTFGYTEQGREVNIDNVTIDNIEDLFAVNGDMNPQGI